MKIALCGAISSGKDTVADYLVNFREFRRESFASSLKDAVAAIFGWDRTLLEGRTAESRAWRETVDPWWSQRLGIPGLTPRWVLQYWGTEVCRIGFYDGIWVASLEYKLRNSQDNIVITDCRFPNEISTIRESGGFVLRVNRGPRPEWYELGVASAAGDTLAAAHLKNQWGVHASETAWMAETFDAVLDNNGTISDLYDQIERFLNDQASSRLSSTEDQS